MPKRLLLLVYHFHLLVGLLFLYIDQASPWGFCSFLIVIICNLGQFDGLSAALSLVLFLVGQWVREIKEEWLRLMACRRLIVLSSHCLPEYSIGTTGVSALPIRD